MSSPALEYGLASRLALANRMSNVKMAVLSLHSLKSFHSPDLLEPCHDLRKSPGWSAGRW